MTDKINDDLSTDPRPRYCDMRDIGSEKPLIIDRLELNKWYEIPIANTEFVERELQIPLKHNTKYTVDIKFDGELDFKKKKMEDFLNNTESFPASRYVFERYNMKRTPEGIYRFEATCRMPRLPLTLEETEANTKKAIRKEHLGTYKVDPRIISAIKDQTLEKTILKLYTLIKNYSTSEEVPDMDYFDFEKLHQVLSEERVVLGDCKSVSTMTIGIANGLGLAARRMEGQVAFKRSTDELIQELENKIEGQISKQKMYKSEKDKTSHNQLTKHIQIIRKRLEKIKPGQTCVDVGIHTWAEIYVPTPLDLGSWILVDPAMHHIGGYNTKQILYVADCKLPNLTKAKKLKIRVKYEEIAKKAAMYKLMKALGI